MKKRWAWGAVAAAGLAALGGLAVALAAPPRAGAARLHYRRLPDLPPQQGRPNPGVAGAFAGVSHGMLLVAGGANFPNGYPWEGGKKAWQSAIYALPLTGKAADWQLAGHLGHSLAYGASAGWRNQLIALGGNDAQGPQAHAFALSWDAAAGQVRTDSLPALPLPLANHAAAVLGNVLYVVGGESAHGPEKSLYALDLLRPALGWQRRADLPGPARAFTALVAQAGALYVLGGRATTNGHTIVFRDAYSYEPKADSWAALPDLPTPLAAHNAAPGGLGALLIFGGDDGERLGQIEALNRQLGALPDTDPAKADLVAQRNKLQAVHPGFRREVWQFCLASRTWSVAGQLPFPTPVTTPAVPWGRQVLLPSGEVSPGVRSPASWQVTLPRAW